LAREANIKLWFVSGGPYDEMNGQLLSSLGALHEMSNPPVWEEIGSTTGGPTDGFAYVEGTTSSYGRFTAGMPGVNLIELDYFTATSDRRSVVLDWATLSEVDNAGFNIWRANRANGIYIKINPALIPAQGGPVFGATYQYADTLVRTGRSYYYKLEDVDLYGNSTFHGPIPVSATVSR
jgi:hypothetical protein